MRLFVLRLPVAELSEDENGELLELIGLVIKGLLGRVKRKKGAPRIPARPGLSPKGRTLTRGEGSFASGRDERSSNQEGL